MPHDINFTENLFNEFINFPTLKQLYRNREDFLSSHFDTAGNVFINFHLKYKIRLYAYKNQRIFSPISRLHCLKTRKRRQAKVKKRDEK